MKKLYVVGDKSSKSLSPTIFNHWFLKYKIKAKYNHIEINKKNFDKKIQKLLREKNLLGLNITTPYKKTIIKYLDDLDSHSKKINAVNCVLFIKGKKRGINTDWIGYKNSLKKIKINKNKKILIIGYGGAAQAVHYCFLKNGFKNTHVFNRTKKKIIKTKKYTKNFNEIKKHTKEATLIINTTPTNILKKDTAAQINKNTIVSEIVYRPKITKFLKQFPDNKKIFGIEMLIQQAVPCFKKWFGFTPSVDHVLLNKLDKKIK